jgi:hypothetical protein
MLVLLVHVTRDVLRGLTSSNMIVVKGGQGSSGQPWASLTDTTIYMAIRLVLKEFTWLQILRGWWTAAVVGVIAVVDGSVLLLH